MAPARSLALVSLLGLLGLGALPFGQPALEGDAVSRLGPPMAAALPPPPPVNLTGTYKGQWGKQLWPDNMPGHLLQRQDGTAVLKLKAREGKQPGLHSVQGDVILRDGTFVSQGDALFHLQGVYVVALGKLIAVAEPARPFRLPVEQSQPTARGALGRARSASTGSSNGEGLAHEYRQALREAAGDLVAVADTRGGAAALLPGLLEARVASMGRECAFTLELHFRPAYSSDEESGSGSSSSEPSRAMRRLRPGGKEGGEEGQDFELRGSLVSPGCGVELRLDGATTHMENFYAKAANYTLLVTAIAFAQVLLLVGQMEAASTQALASRVSLLMLGQQAVLDAYLCLLHLTVGIMIEPLFSSFSLSSFCEFVVFAVFELRFMLSAWRARRGAALDPWSAQRELSILYARFYGALLGGILLSYHLQRWMSIVIFALYSFWLPQVALCAREDCRQPLRPAYVLGISASRLALPLYLYGCPHNLLRIAPNPGLCVMLTLFVGAQAGLLLLQHRYGPRCFVPKRFLPAKYDYHRPAPPRRGDIETGEGGAECVICMQGLELSNKTERMLTPCGHSFHNHCLSRWMAVKFECPTCRSPLPLP